MRRMNEKWTISDIPDQTGRRAIVTGGNSGIGWHTALGLARAGAEVTIAARDQAKASAAADAIEPSYSPWLLSSPRFSAP